MDVLTPVSAADTPLAQAQPLNSVRPDVVAAVRDLVDRAGGGPVNGYLYDPSIAADRARELRAALPAWATLLYAVKANGFEPIVRALIEGGVDGLEVASSSEATLARSVLPPGRALVAAGPAKHPALLAELLDRGVSVVHAESVTELHRIDAVARSRGVRVPVALRVNPARVGLGGTLAMGGCDSAFGVPERDAPAAVSLASSLPGIDLVGFHVHAASGNRDARAHARYVAAVLDWSTATARQHGVDLRWVDVGGGLGVSYDGVGPLDLAVLAAELDRLRPPAGVEVVLEPGRWLAADCGWYAAQVVDLKDSHRSTFAVVRGGINSFCLPATEDFPFPMAVVPVDPWSERFARPRRDRAVLTVSGELCTPEDVLVRDVEVDRVRVNDVLLFPCAGAYGFEFALRDFLGHPAATRTLLAETPATTPTADVSAPLLPTTGER